MQPHHSTSHSSTYCIFATNPNIQFQRANITKSQRLSLISIFDKFLHFVHHLKLIVRTIRSFFLFYSPKQIQYPNLPAASSCGIKSNIFSSQMPPSFNISHKSSILVSYRDEMIGFEDVWEMQKSPQQNARQSSIYQIDMNMFHKGPEQRDRNRKRRKIEPSCLFLLSWAEFGNCMQEVFSPHLSIWKMLFMVLACNISR